MAKQILVVASDPALVGALGPFLERKALVAVHATDMPSALGRFRSLLIDVVVLSLQLDNGDSLQLCRALRREPNGPLIPVVFVGGPDNSGPVRSPTDALEHGGDDFFPLPGDFEDLALCVHQWTQRKLQSQTMRPSAATDDVDFDIDLAGLSRNHEAVTQPGYRIDDVFASDPKIIDDTQDQPRMLSPDALVRIDPTGDMSDTALTKATSLIAEADASLANANTKDAIDLLGKAASVFESEGAIDQAIDIYRRMQELDPEQVSFARKAGGLALTAGRPEAAMSIYDDAVNAASQRGSFNTAIIFLHEMRRINPDKKDIGDRIAVLESELAEEEEEEETVSGFSPEGEESFSSAFDRVLGLNLTNDLPEIDAPLADSLGPLEAAELPDVDAIGFSPEGEKTADFEPELETTGDRRPIREEDLLEPDAMVGLTGEIEITGSFRAGLVEAPALREIDEAEAFHIDIEDPVSAPPFTDEDEKTSPAPEDRDPTPVQHGWSEVVRAKSKSQTPERPPPPARPPRRVSKRRPLPPPAIAQAAAQPPIDDQVTDINGAVRYLAVLRAQRAGGLLRAHPEIPIVFFEGNPVACRGPVAMGRFARGVVENSRCAPSVVTTHAKKAEHPVGLARSLVGAGHLGEHEGTVLLKRHFERVLVEAMRQRGQWTFEHAPPVEVVREEIIPDIEDGLRLLIEALPGATSTAELIDAAGGPNTRLRVSLLITEVKPSDARFVGMLDGVHRLQDASELAGQPLDRAAAIALVYLYFGLATALPPATAGTSWLPLSDRPSVPLRSEIPLAALAAPSMLPTQPRATELLSTLSAEGRLHALRDMIRTADYFTILGLDLSADDQAVQDAHARVRASVRSELFGDDEALMLMADDVARALDEARDILSVPHLRDAYRKHLGK